MCIITCELCAYIWAWKHIVCGSYLADQFALDYFSLRRARLDTEEPSSAAGDSRRKKTDVAPSTITNPANKSKKNVDPPKSAQARSTAKGKSPKPDTFSRTDCGRYSVRAPRTISQVRTLVPGCEPWWISWFSGWRLHFLQCLPSLQLQCSFIPL